VGLGCGHYDAASSSGYLEFIPTDMPRLMRTEGSRGPCSSATCMIGKGQPECNEARDDAAKSEPG
jgi:hypothetical protein